MSKNSRDYMPTYALIAVNVAVYAFTAILSGNAVVTSNDVLNSFGQWNAAVWNGEYWRLLTAIFIHADIAHIFGNMLFLLIFGLRAEEMFDLKEYLSIYLLSGLFGSLLTLAFWPPDTVSVGASGAIFGVLGAAIIYPRRSIGQSVMTGLMYAFFWFFINSFSGNTNFLAHLGGLLTGLLIGYGLAASRKSRPSVTYRYSYPSTWGRK